MDQEIKDLFLSNLVVAGGAAAAVVVSSLAMMSDFETWCSGTEEPDCQWHCQCYKYCETDCYMSVASECL